MCCPITTSKDNNRLFRMLCQRCQRTSLIRSLGSRHCNGYDPSYFIKFTVSEGEKRCRETELTDSAIAQRRQDELSVPVIGSGDVHIHAFGARILRIRLPIRLCCKLDNRAHPPSRHSTCWSPTADEIHAQWLTTISSVTAASDWMQCRMFQHLVVYHILRQCRGQLPTIAGGRRGPFN